MSILNINELRDLAINKNLLGSDFLESNFQPSSYDLRIGSIFKDDLIYSKDFEKQGFTNSIDIKPSEIVSMLTLERVTVPNDCIATVFAINKHSSTGLLILNPGHIDPGFSGSISICAINLSSEKRTLSIGEPIFTLIVQKLNKELSETEVYKNKLFNSRKEEEQVFLKTKSKKLSNSFFDLVTGYDKAKDLLATKMWNLFWDGLGSFGKILAIFAGFAGILKLGYDAFPDTMPVFRNDNNNSVDSVLIHKRDSIISKQKIEISNLKDSLNKLKK